MTRLLIRREGDNNWRTPEVTAYDNEARLQALLADSPHLLPGINDGESVATAIEFPVPDTGSADLVCVDSQGQITIVECKLRANPDIRRQVIGQVFAYAAGMSSMGFEEFEAAFSRAADHPLMQQLGGDTADTEPVRASISDNLAVGRFRLIIAVDEITPELQRVVRYLNQHTKSDVDLLAIELRYIRHSDVEILVPEVYGEESAQNKQTTTGRRKWDESSVFQSLEQCCTSEGYRAAVTLWEFLKSKGARINWGTGVLPSATARLSVNGRVVSLVSYYNWPVDVGTVAINFEYLLDVVPIERISAFANQLKQVPGVSERYAGLEEAGYRKRPSVPFDEVLTQPGAVETFQQAIDDLISNPSAARTGS